MDIKFIEPKKGLTVKLMHSGFSFSRECVQALGVPPFIEFLLDVQNKILYVKPTDTETPDTYHFANSEKKKNRTIIVHGGRAANKICTLEKLKPLKKGVIFNAEIKEDVLRIDLSAHCPCI